MANSPTPAKTFEVVDVLGNVVTIKADFIFENQGTLVFRAGERGQSEIVATFGPGQWVSMVKKEG